MLDFGETLWSYKGTKIQIELHQGANGCVVNDEHETPQGLRREKSSSTVTATGKCGMYVSSSSTSLRYYWIILHVK